MKNSLIFLSFFSIYFSQSLEIHGRIVHEKTQNPIPDVNIISEIQGASSDQNGYFDIQVESGNEISITHIGFKPVNIQINDLSNIVVSLVPIILEGREVLVLSGLLAESFEKTTSSVIVMNSNEIRSSNGLHFQDVIGKIPGLNWAGGTSRPRYFQIRGLGERSQYAGEGAPNFSVGFMADDIDLSGMGMASFLFDMKQIEIFKGPQSSIYGPNAMGGLISMRSMNPFDSSPNRLSLTLGSDHIWRSGIGFGGKISPTLAYRLSFSSGHGDGFRENIYQRSTTTNGKNEANLRLKLEMKPSKKTDLLLTLFRSELNNGYDAWAPDNNTELKTYTDVRGLDSMGTQAYSLRTETELPFKNINFTAILSQSKNTLRHSYDGDWGNDEYWLSHHGFDPDSTGWRYSFYDQTLRLRNTKTQDYRLNRQEKNSSFLIGYYSKELEEKDTATGYIFGGDATALQSRFNIENHAIYAQIQYELNAELQFKINGRSERQRTRYLGESLNEWVSEDTNQVKTESYDQFSGGKMSLLYEGNPIGKFWISLARGYKAGGINQHPSLSDYNRAFEPEFIKNVEFGFRKLASSYAIDFILFYGLIDQKQVSISSQQVEGDPNSFVHYTANATQAIIRGFDWSQKVKISHALSGRINFSFLDSFVDDFSFQSDSVEISYGGGRSLAHAPKKQIMVELNYESPKGFFSSFSYQYKSEFYFSDSHNQRSEAYGLLNGKLGFKFESWSLNVWVKNMTDIRFATRGFYFGLVPPDYPDKLYLSYGEPQHFGLSLETEF
ncbi:MAG: TonB-dependent receptor [Candidatus Marinimicrobia bacterium]|jgi:outer membrane receptor protein involved in Fe transport|nr:TonB-dependent receptor [Candidatus Neomarinimicrobiota bacterium]MBT3691591.1 TonB-dependent receptor [Candidatus Neomarinimicrobiota bacterium]MBT3731462.1 TonB-dependent receptor [Candidatus Neomarinimicrobiota bacterium]MBT4144164.1 TonB-dependent receptor [Candidatus Neomarinimicrobiota bacterium]MBT4178529.1 TonB-dependent receptor [Candidatus Neomarinimicrobiota bacterium]